MKSCGNMDLKLPTKLSQKALNMKEKNPIRNWIEGKTTFEDIAPMLLKARQERTSWSSFDNNDIDINIFLRSNINWEYMTYEQLVLASHQENFPSALLKGISLWEENIDISFFDYRMKLQKMAELCWSRIASVDSLMKDSHNYIDMLVCHDSSQKFILLPTDDDDWFAPHISQILIEAYSNNMDADVITWRGAELSYTHGYNPKVSSRFSTNTYAFTDKGLRKLKKLGSDVLDIVVRRHAAANRFYSEFESQYNILHLDCEECHSVKNSSPASVLSVQRLARGELTIRKFKEFANQEFGEVPQEMHWAKEYIDLMHEFKLS